MVIKVTYVDYQSDKFINPLVEFLKHRPMYFTMQIPLAFRCLLGDAWGWIGGILVLGCGECGGRSGPVGGWEPAFGRMGKLTYSVPAAGWAGVPYTRHKLQ